MRCAVGRLTPVVAALAAAVTLAACDHDTSQPPAENGRPTSAAAPPRAETVRVCRTAVYGELAPGARQDVVTAGPLALLVADGERRRAVEPSGVVKVLALVRAGATLTVVVPEGERRRLSLLYDLKAGPRRPLRLSDGTSSVRFTACAPGEEWAEEQPYPDANETQFNGGFFVRGAHCAPLEVWVDGQEGPLRLALGFGTGDRPCPSEEASAR